MVKLMECASRAPMPKSTPAYPILSPNHHQVTTGHHARKADSSLHLCMATLNLYRMSRRGTIAHPRCHSKGVNIVRSWSGSGEISGGINGGEGVSARSFKVAPPQWPGVPVPGTFGYGVQVWYQVARKNHARGLSQSQTGEGRGNVCTNGNDSRGSSSNGIGSQGGRGFTALASLKAQLDRAAIANPTSNIGLEDKVAAMVTMENLKSIPSFSPAVKQPTGTCTSTSGQPFQKRNSSYVNLSKTKDSPQKSTQTALERESTIPQIASVSGHEEVEASLSVCTLAEERESQEILKQPPNWKRKLKSSKEGAQPLLDPLSPEVDRVGTSRIAAMKEQTRGRKTTRGREKGARLDVSVRNKREAQNAVTGNAFGWVNDDQAAGVSKGATILAAMQRAAAAQKAKPVPKKRVGGDTVQVKGEDQGTSQAVDDIPLQPIVMKTEWINQIRSLETLLNKLKQVSK